MSITVAWRHDVCRLIAADQNKVSPTHNLTPFAKKRGKNLIQVGQWPRIKEWRTRRKNFMSRWEGGTQNAFKGRP